MRPNMVRASFPLILLLFAATVGRGANAEWSLRKWQSDDGLPNNTVTGLAQTSDGYLWIASPGPLARFDGDRFEQFTPSQIVPGYHQNARALLQARDGSLWIAMAHGPLFRVRANDTVDIYTNDLPDLIVQRFLEDGEGGVWMLYPGGQIRRMKDGKVQSFIATGGWPTNYFGASLGCDGKGSVWGIKGRDLMQYRDGRFQAVCQLSEASSITQLAGSQKGGVWLCSGSHLFKYDDQAGLQDLGVFQTATASEGMILYEARNGDLWIGTSSAGLYHYDATGFQHIETSYQQILSIIEDDEGNIWVGTGGGGLDRIRPSALRLQVEEDGVPFEAVQSICEETNGTLWAATANGLLARRSGEHWSLVTTNEGWAGDTAGCVTVDHRGNVWVGSKAAVSCWNGSEWRTWRRADGLGVNRVYALLAARNGDLYVAGAMPDNLQRLRDGNWQDLQLPPRIGYIRAMVEDLAGNIWAGNAKGNLLRIRGDTVTEETTNTFGIPTSIRAMCATPDGSLWIACAGGGLGWLGRDGRFARIMAEQGLYDNYLSQVLDDGLGWLWFGSDHGIFKIRQQALIDVAEGRASSVQCIHYGRSAGLSGLQANFGHWPGTLRGHDGLLWMPMRTALAVANPRGNEEKFTPPPVLLKKVMLDGEPVASYGKILPAEGQVNLSSAKTSLHLPPKHFRLEFNFTALDFSAPENVNFRYQLEGFDTHWINTGTERSASYSRLPAGSYHFKVQARNGDGEWSESGVLAVIVSPFMWQTWWFRAAALLLFTAGVIAAVRYVSFRRLRSKLQALEQQAVLDRERARIARDIHDDLGGSLTQVAMLSGLAGREGGDAAKTGEYVQRISATTHQVIRALDEVVWAVNPRNDNLRDMLQYIGQFAIEFLSAAGIRLQLDLPEKLSPQPVSAEVRHNLFLVTKETLNNITRHAQATEVRLRAKVTGTLFTMVIEDNGQGFSGPPGDAFANGVRNMRQRMEEIGGRCDIESEAGKGTRVTMSFPVRWTENHGADPIG